MGTLLEWVKLLLERFDSRRKEKREQAAALIKKMDDLGAKIDEFADVSEDLREQQNALAKEIVNLKESDSKSREQVITQLELIKQGLQKVLFETLCKQCKEFSEQGYCSPNDKGAYQEVYDIYHSFGKNGRADVYLDKVMNMPDER